MLMGFGSGCPARSAGIAPVGGLRAALWVAKRRAWKGPSHRYRPAAELGSLGWQWKPMLFSTLRRASQLTATLLVITKVKGNLWAGQNLCQPPSQQTCCCV